MKIAVTGYDGRLGTALVELGCTPINCDITGMASLCDAIYSANPDFIVHCAGITDVDFCENNVDEAFKVNVKGLNNLLTCVGNMYPRPRIVFLSTDYIFDGKRGPYDEKAKPNPMGKYGLLKLAGETLLNDNDIIVRTTILYGSKAKPDFVTKVLDKFDKGEPFDVPDNMVGNPTYVPHLAEAIMTLLQINDPPHVVNIAGLDRVSRYEFALTIAHIFGKKKLLANPVHVKEGYRPLRAGFKLNLADNLGLPLYSMTDGLREMKWKMK